MRCCTVTLVGGDLGLSIGFGVTCISSLVFEFKFGGKWMEELLHLPLHQNLREVSHPKPRGTREGSRVVEISFRIPPPFTNPSSANLGSTINTSQKLSLPPLRFVPTNWPYPTSLSLSWSLARTTTEDIGLLLSSFRAITRSGVVWLVLCPQFRSKYFVDFGIIDRLQIPWHKEAWLSVFV